MILIIISLCFVLLILISISAFFSFSEMAISSASKIKLQSIVQKNKNNKSVRRAKRVLNFVNNYNEHITAIVIFNNVVNVLISTLSTFIFGTLIFKGSFVGYAISFVLMTVLIIVFGELLPKLLAKKMPEKGTMKFSWVLQAVNLILKPVTYLLSKMINEEKRSSLASDEEINIALEESTLHGITNKYEQNIIKKTLYIDEQTIKKIIVPKKDVISLPVNITISKAIKAVTKYSHSRFPLINKDGKVEGILSTGKLLQDKLANKSIILSNYILDFLELEMDDEILTAFENLRSRRNKMAIINDEDGFMLGIVTMEDIIESILGEIYDEEDLEKDGVYELSPTTFLVEGDVSVKYFIENYSHKLKLPAKDSDLKISEFFKNINGGEFNDGDHFIYKNNII